MSSNHSRSEEQQALIKRYVDEYTDEFIIPEKQAFLSKKGLVWGENEQKYMSDLIIQLEKDPSPALQWMENYLYEKESQRQTKDEHAFFKQWIETYFHEVALPEKKEFMERRGFVWGHEDDIEAQILKINLVKNPAPVWAWMNHHSDYNEIYNEHYGRNGSFKTNSKAHDDEDEELDGEKPPRGRFAKRVKEPVVRDYDNLDLEDQMLIQAKIKLIQAVRKEGAYQKVASSIRFEDSLTKVIHLVRKEAAELMVSTNDPERFEEMVKKYLEKKVTGDPRRLFVDDEMAREGYEIFKNLKGGQEM